LFYVIEIDNQIEEDDSNLEEIVEVSGNRN
jgi:hypothetical protein